MQGTKYRVPTGIEETYPQWLPPRDYKADGTLLSPSYGELDHLYESAALGKCRVILVSLLSTSVQNSTGNFGNFP